MTKLFQIITDSSCDLPQSLADELDLRVLPLHVTIDGKTYNNYLDGREIAFKDFFDKLRAGSQGTTSAVNPEEFRAEMEPVLAAGLDVLYVGFSSGLSTTYQSGCIAADEAAREVSGAQNFDHRQPRRVARRRTVCLSRGEEAAVRRDDRGDV